MQLKTLLYLVSIIKIMHIKQTYLQELSHAIRKLEWIWYIFQYSNFGVTYIFKVPIVYYYLVISISNWWKIRHFSSKPLSWWYIHAHPESCKIIHQVSVQTLVCVCISITSCKNKNVHFRGAIWILKCIVLFLPYDRCHNGFPLDLARPKNKNNVESPPIFFI